MMMSANPGARPLHAPIRHRAGDPRRCRIEGENAITVQMQDRIEPSRQISALAPGTLAPRLGNSIHDFRDRSADTNKAADANPSNL